MTILRRLTLLRRRLTHTALLHLSTTYRDASHWRSLYDIETQQHHRYKAEASNASTCLADAQSQIQTLTLSAQQAARDADRYRVERDESREREAVALRMLADKLNPIVDVLAVRVLGQQIYGSLPQTPRPPEPEPQVLGRSQHGRRVVNAETQRIMDEMEKLEQDRQARMRQEVANGQN